LLLQGKVYRLLGDPGKAREKFLAATEAGQGGESWLSLGDVELELSRPDAARNAAEQALQRDPKDARAHYLNGRALLAAGETRAAVSALERAVELDPALEGALYALGQALLRAGEPERGRAVLERFREIQTTQAASYAESGHLTTANRQGLLLLREGRYEEAAAWFRRIAVDAPESPVGHLNLGIALLRAGKVAEAVAALEAARQRDPEEPAAYRYLIQAYAQLGREGERRAAEEQLRRLNLAR
jgi:predicted Zn-dependent protease